MVAISRLRSQEVLGWMRLKRPRARLTLRIIKISLLQSRVGNIIEEPHQYPDSKNHEFKLSKLTLACNLCSHRVLYPVSMPWINIHLLTLLDALITLKYNLSQSLKEGKDAMRINPFSPRTWQMALPLHQWKPLPRSLKLFLKKLQANLAALETTTRAWPSKRWQQLPETP